MEYLVDNFNNKIYLKSNNAKIFYNLITKNYDMNDVRLSGKLFHTFRVADACIEVGKKLNLNENICYDIGLLHDYSRFYQWKTYHTFYDYLSVDHADMSAKLLFDEGEIKQFDINENNFNLIKLAIKNHNKAEINLEEFSDFDKTEYDEILTYCKLIRDCDKLDIIYRLSQGDIKIEFSGNGLSPKIQEKLDKFTYVKNKDVKTTLDTILKHIGYMFDINYFETLSYINFNKLWNDIFNNYSLILNEEDRITLQNYLNKFKNYFENKIKK